MLETYMVLTCCTSKMPRWGDDWWDDSYYKENNFHNS